MQYVEDPAGILKENVELHLANKRNCLVYVAAATSRLSLEILIDKSIGNTDDSLVGVVIV